MNQKTINSLLPPVQQTLQVNLDFIKIICYIDLGVQIRHKSIRRDSEFAGLGW